MLNINKILFPTDFSRCADQALDHALFLAKYYQADLHMLHAIVLHEDDPHDAVHFFPDAEEIHDTLKEVASVQMEKVVQKHGTRHLTIHQVQERGVSAASVILDYAGDNGIDLIVMGTHGRRGLEHLFLGSVGEEVVRKAKSPVLTIREYEAPKPIEWIENVLVPVDFSENTKDLLTYAKEAAATYDARLQLVHVVEDLVHPSFYVLGGETSILKLIPDITVKTKEKMRELLNDAPGPDVSADVYVAEGRAPKEIVEFAEAHDTDLIVMATHGLTGLDYFLLGSVAEKVIRRAPCPVLTVKVFGKSLI